MAVEETKNALVIPVGDHYCRIELQIAVFDLFFALEKLRCSYRMRVLDLSTSPHWRKTMSNFDVPELSQPLKLFYYGSTPWAITYRDSLLRFNPTLAH